MFSALAVAWLIMLGLIAGIAGSAEAASWQWSSLPGRERIEVRFDKPTKESSASRTGTTQLTIQLGSPASGFTGSGSGQIVRGVAADADTLCLSLRDPAFGYVVSRPNSTTMRVDVFADALGARWKGPVTGAASATPTAASPTLPVPSPATPPVRETPTPAPTVQVPLTVSPAAAAGLITSGTAPTSGTSGTAPTSGTSGTASTSGTSGTASTSGRIGTPLPKSPAAATSNIPPGEFVPLGPAPRENTQPATSAISATSATPATPTSSANGTAQNTTGRNGAPRADARTEGRTPLSNGRNVMAGPSNGTGAQTPPPAVANVGESPVAVPPSGASLVDATLAGIRPEDIPKDPAVPLPSTGDLSRMTGRIESLGVGEPRPDNALGSVRGRMDSNQPSRAVAVAPTPVETPPVPVRPVETPPVRQAPAQTSAPTTESQPVNQMTGSFRQSLSGEPATQPAVFASPVNAVPPAPPATSVLPARNGQPVTPRTSAENWAATADQTAAMLAAMPPVSRPIPAPALAAAPVSPEPVPESVQTPMARPVVVAEATQEPAPASNGSAFRGRMLRPGERPESATSTPVVAPTPPAPPVAPAPQASQATQAAPATPVAPAPPATLAAPTTTTVADAGTAGTTNGANAQPVNAQRQSMRQSLTGGSPEKASDAAPAPATTPSSPLAALPKAVIPPVVPDSSVVQHTRETAGPAVVGGKSATDAALTPTPPVEEAPEAEARQMLSGSGVLGKNTEPKPEDTTVIYVDEKGNVVDKPPDVPALMKEVQQQMNNLQFQTALDLLLPIKDMVLPPETREQVLYAISECLANVHKENPLAGYEPITKATSEAMNYNLNSERVPEAMYRLGVLNLRVGNQQDAAGYFGAMRNRYPHVDSVPYGYFALGQDQLANKQYGEAVRSFQTIMDEYPESKAVRDAARGMAEALYRQGHYDRAQILVDFVDRRWPRIYLDDPTYLPMVGEIQTRMQDYDNALQTYWTSYNLTPDAPDNHKLLLQIGAIYLQSGFTKGARHVFAELLRKYPKSESAPKAVLLMAEQGFAKENPTLDEMFTIFSRPGDMPVETAYRRLMADYPDSPEALQAELRTAALDYWNGDTDEAMRKAQAFRTRYPEKPESERAREIILRGFAGALELAKQEENYERILSLWERYPLVQEAYQNPDDDMRVAMARGRLNRGDEAAGLAELAPFLDRPQGKYSDYVYNLFLAKHLQDSNWNGILELGDKVQDWKMPTDVRNQLDYSRAISAENMGMKARSMPIWDRLRKLPDGELPLYQKAYATYFMAREAESRSDLKDAYDLNLRTLDLFTQLEEERSDKADPERVRESLAGLMDVTEVAGRFAEALEWTDRYGVFVPQDSPDYAGLLFRQARLHRKMGDMARWRSLLDTIVLREPDSVFGRMAASELRTQEVSRNLTRFTEQPKPPAAPATPAAPAAPAPQTGDAAPAAPEQ